MFKLAKRLEVLVYLFFGTYLQPVSLLLLSFFRAVCQSEAEWLLQPQPVTLLTVPFFVAPFQEFSRLFAEIYYWIESPH